jgi:colicin import membrane protein
MSEDKTEPNVEEKSTDNSASKKPSVEETAKAESAKAESAKAVKEAKTASDATAKAESTAKAAEDAEVAAKEAIAKAAAAKIEAEKAAEEEYKAIADEVKADVAKKTDYTFKRQGEEIFRREMDEPEFFLDKKDRLPRPILSADEQESLTRKAETPQDQTPSYIPEHVLSPEYGGVSNYEREVSIFLKDAKERLEKLKNNSETTKQQIQESQNEITYLESIHENFFIGMNVFRTAKGGRDKIKV